MRTISWGRGQPDHETIQPGPDYDADLDKKPRAGQILWIRGLTRLQTQVCTLLSTQPGRTFGSVLGKVGFIITNKLDNFWNLKNNYTNIFFLSLNILCIFCFFFFAKNVLMSFFETRCIVFKTIEIY